MRKSGGQTSFACYVRNQTETALELSVPLGMVNDLPTIDQYTFDALLDVNRCRYAAPLESSATQQSEPEQPDLPPDDQEPATTTSGTGHRELQQLLKQAAQHYGHSADIEYPVLKGAGSVDVAISAIGRTIACEISATTRPDHELHNARKCLLAGFSEVWMIAEDSTHLSSIREHLAAALEPAELASVKFLSSEAALREIEALPRANPAMRSRAFGYDIEIQLQPQSTEQKAGRRYALSQLLTQSKVSP